MKTRLLGSAATLEGLQKLVSQFYYNPLVSFYPVADAQWRVVVGTKNLDGVRVVLKKKRYRFEMEVA